MLSVRKTITQSSPPFREWQRQRHFSHYICLLLINKNTSLWILSWQTVGTDLQLCCFSNAHVYIAGGIWPDVSTGHGPLCSWTALGSSDWAVFPQHPLAKGPRTPHRHPQIPKSTDAEVSCTKWHCVCVWSMYILPEYLKASPDSLYLTQCKWDLKKLLCCIVYGIRRRKKLCICIVQTQGFFWIFSTQSWHELVTGNGEKRKNEKEPALWIFRITQLFLS